MHFLNVIGFTVGLGLGSISAQANELTPQDAMNETKIGIAGRFVPIRAGTFRTKILKHERDVTVKNDFEMQATELTQLQFSLLMGLNPSEFTYEKECDPGNYNTTYGFKMCKNHPVESVSWSDLQELIGKLNALQDRYTYRLPTMEEWEYASRGGAPANYDFWFGFGTKSGKTDCGGQFPCGNWNLYAWYFDFHREGRTHQVAQKTPNPFGLYDMYGNVWEFVQNRYINFYEDASEPEDSDADRVILGSAWTDHPSSNGIVSTLSRITRLYETNKDLGARLVRTRR